MSAKNIEKSEDKSSYSDLAKSCLRIENLSIWVQFGSEQVETGEGFFDELLKRSRFMLTALKSQQKIQDFMIYTPLVTQASKLAPRIFKHQPSLLIGTGIPIFENIYFELNQDQSAIQLGLQGAPSEFVKLKANWLIMRTNKYLEAKSIDKVVDPIPV